MSETTQYVPYKVKDMSLADWGRTEIKIAEAENARTYGTPRGVRC